MMKAGSDESSHPVVALAHRRVAAVAAAVALAAAGTFPSLLWAQEATSDDPGVIERGEQEQQEEQQDQGSDQNQQNQGRQNQGNQPGSGQQQPDQQGQVITPDNANPNEKYNLPPNFDPNYKPDKRPRNVKVTIDFRKAKLEEVVKFFSGAMNKNFIIANSIQANKTITIISPEKVSLAEAYRAFLAALEMNGLTVVRMGNFLKIVQSKQAMSEPSRTYEDGDRIPNEARMVTAILPVENADVQRIKEIIGNFTSPAATVLPYQDKLIISENAANLRRLRRIVRRLDQGGAGKEVFVYKVQYADATKVVKKLQEIFPTDGQQGGGNQNQGGGKAKELQADISQLIADKRTNQLIVVSDKESFEKVKDMIELLDVPTKAGGGQVHVKFLEYANAEDLASTLSNLVSAAQSARQQGGGGGRRARGEGGGAQQVAAVLKGDVQITAYKPNNALVVVASPKDYVALEQVIDELDRARKQVYVEAVIMEISLDTNRSLGLGFNTGLGQDFQGVIPDSAVENDTVSGTEGLIVGQSNFPGLQGLAGALSGKGASIGLLGPLVNIPGTNISLPAFAMLLEATQTDNSVNILSTPSILTMDNKEAEIVVGERVPFATGVGGGLGGGGGGLGGLGSLAAGSALGQQNQRQDTANQSVGNQGGLGAGGLGAGGLGGGLGAGLGALGGLGGFSSIQYQDVGLTLRIKPQVNDSRYVRLEVDQEVSSLKGAGTDDLTPAQTRRNAKTTVLVKDQHTVVIGGLIRDEKNETVEKVPILGDIPLIGRLFHQTSTITTKQNLVLLLTPYIIQSESDLQKIYERKLKERRELLKLLGRHGSKYMSKVDFGKKRGIVDRMHRKISEAVQDKKARDEAREAFEQKGPRYQILGPESAPEPEQQSESEQESGREESGTAESGGSEGASESGEQEETSESDEEGASSESEEGGEE